MLDSLHLWLDANIELNLSREAVDALGRVMRSWPRDQHHAELVSAGNVIRAHLQHLPPKGIPLTDPLLG